MSSPLGLTDCGSEDDYRTFSEPHSFFEQQKILDSSYPSLFSCDGGEGQGPYDSSEFSDLMEPLADGPDCCEDGTGPSSTSALDSYLDILGHPSLAAQYPGYTPALNSADSTAHVAANPGPANFFDGVPVLDS